MPVKTRKKIESFSVKGLRVSVDGNTIVRDASFSMKPGEIHVLVGPNGSGKSTLLNALFGNPHTLVGRGSITLDGQSILPLTVDARARKGLFLGFQQPVEIPGVTIGSFLRMAKNARSKSHMTPVEFSGELKKALKQMNMDERFGGRFLNVGFSGGEKKKAEILQMMILKPRFAFLDEFDSGLDVDAFKTLSSIITQAAQEQGIGFLLVSHNPRLHTHLPITAVHVMTEGSIVARGGVDLLEKIDMKGYDSLTKGA